MAGDEGAGSEQFQCPALSWIKPPQCSRLIKSTGAGGLSCPETDTLKAGGNADAEILHPRGNIGVSAALVVVVRGSNGERLVIRRKILRVIFFQRVQAFEIVAAQMENERGEEPRRSAVAVVVWM